MNRSQNNRFTARLAALAQKLKAVLSKDYSLDDLKNIGSVWADLKSHFSDASIAKTEASLSSPSTETSRTVSISTLDLKGFLQVSIVYARSHRKGLLAASAFLLLWLVYSMVLAPYSVRIQEQIEMRPAQWSQLQSLIHLSKSSSAGTSHAQAPGMGSTVSALDEMELQKIRGTLSARGIKPSVLRLTTDNPPRLELQVNEMIFSVWLDTLEELRTNWRLYPERLGMSASNGPGMVNLSGVLTQYSSSGSATR